MLTIGILTVSDRAAAGEYEDRGGPAIRDYFDNLLSNEWRAISLVVSDERDLIEAALIELVEGDGCHFVVTTGGTGPALRDVTPEATKAVCERMMPGFAEAMRAESLKFVPTAILSRQVAGLRGSSLILNLPGNPKAIAECLDAVMEAVPYCLDLMEAPWMEFKEGHKLKAFRPKHAKKPG
ncbi:MAG: molybdopterin adenylyltransferase [Planctomycetes bacterium]|nr:molybdopterin adenylyltransferase [Planctomycetota bacterium]